MNNQTAMFTSEQMSGNGRQTNMLDQINNTEDRINELKRTPHNFWNDGGHGWLEVRKSDLVMLQIANKISGYSYQDGEKAYLEEDCDAGVYIRALWGNNLESAEYNMFRTHCLRDMYRENIFVRRLAHYQPFLHRLNKNGLK